MNTGTEGANPGRRDFELLAREAGRRGQAAHGDFGIASDAFSARLLSIARKYIGPHASWTAVIEFTDRLHAEDLYLTFGCELRSEDAWHRFTSIYRKCVQQLSHHLALTPDAAMDLADLTLIDMFLPDRSGNSRLASYDGRSSLLTWIKVIISNRAINERQRMWNRVERPGSAPETADKDAVERLEFGLRSGRYAGLLGDSLQSVCSGLSPAERLILLWRYEDGLQLGEIARLLGVHQSTVTRQLERLVKRLRAEVLSILTTKYGLSPAAVEECLSVVLESPPLPIPVLTFIQSAPGVDASRSGSSRLRELQEKSPGSSGCQKTRRTKVN